MSTDETTLARDGSLALLTDSPAAGHGETSKVRIYLILYSPRKRCVTIIIIIIMIIKNARSREIDVARFVLLERIFKRFFSITVVTRS